MEKLGQKLRFLRRQKGMNQTKVAQKIGYTQTAYGKYEQNKALPSFETLTKLAEIFDVKVEYLLGINDENVEKSIKIPVLGSIPAGIPLEAIEEILDYEEIPREWTDKGEYFGLKIRGNSMEPRILNGDVVIVKKQDDAESGDVCVVMVNGYDATLKQIKKENNGLWLIPFNKSYSNMFYSAEQISSLPVRIIGKVVELRGKF